MATPAQVRHFLDAAANGNADAFFILINDYPSLQSHVDEAFDLAASSCRLECVRAALRLGVSKPVISAAFNAALRDDRLPLAQALFSAAPLHPQALAHALCSAADLAQERTLEFFAPLLGETLAVADHPLLIYAIRASSAPCLALLLAQSSPGLNHARSLRLALLKAAPDCARLLLSQTDTTAPPALLLDALSGRSPECVLLILERAAPSLEEARSSLAQALRRDRAKKTSGAPLNNPALPPLASYIERLELSKLTPNPAKKSNFRRV